MKIALENKTAGGEVKLNVYCQEIEPQGKDGIWLETNKEFEKVYFDEQVKKITVEGLDTTKTYPMIKDSNSNGHTSALVGDYIYLFKAGGVVSKYDILNNEIIENIASTSPYTFSSGCDTCVVDTDIYLFGSNNSTSNYSKLFKFDTINHSISVVATISNHGIGALLLYINNKIYLFGGQNTGTRIGYYDILNGSYTSVTTSSPINAYNRTFTAVTNIGNIIYLFGNYGSSTSVYKYSYRLDLDTGIFTQLTDLPRVMYLTACPVNNYIYLFNVDRSVSYKYDVINDTYVNISKVNTNGTSGGKAFLYNDNKIFFVSHDYTYGDIKCYALTYDAVYDYENNSVVIWNGFGKYKTQLTPSANNQEGKIKTLFYNAYHYTTENGLDDTIPTYYGDGIQWVKFKN